MLYEVSLYTKNKEVFEASRKDTPGESEGDIGRHFIPDVKQGTELLRLALVPISNEIDRVEVAIRFPNSVIVEE